MNRQVVLDSDDKYAPSSYILCLVNEHGNWDMYDDDITKLFQTDWSFPGLAREFGFTPCHDDAEPFMDIPCPECDRSADQLVEDVWDYLDKMVGEQVKIEDPGYFLYLDDPNCFCGDNGQWFVANNSGPTGKRKHMWFIARDNAADLMGMYHHGPSGIMLRYKTHKAAVKVCQKLREKERNRSS